VVYGLLFMARLLAATAVIAQALPEVVRNLRIRSI
jgi:hypothetical protein